MIIWGNEVHGIRAWQASHQNLLLRLLDLRFVAGALGAQEIPYHTQLGGVIHGQRWVG